MCDNCVIFFIVKGRLCTAREFPWECDCPKCQGLCECKGEENEHK